MNITEELFCLIRNEINNEPLPNHIELDMKQVLAVSKRHDIAHIVSDAMLKNELVSPKSEQEKKLTHEVSLAVYREIQTTFFLNKIRQVFNDNKIKFVPLKGSVIRDYYPELWMRTSCDVDILIHEEDIEKATIALLKSGFTTDNIRNYHDIHFYYAKNHLELHFSICENSKQLDGVLSKVWDYVKPIGEYEYRECPEFFMFHHIAHMAYHFLSGGCGIRPFIDLWILQKRDFYSEEKLIPLLKECDLCKFYDAVCRLTQVWMTDEKRDDITIAMEKYVLNGGVYGTSENSSAAGVAQKGRLRYLWSIAFPPYNTMCVLYPRCQKHKILLPFCYIHRVFAKIFGKDRRDVKTRAKTRIKTTMSQSKGRIAEVDKLLNLLRLK